MTRALDRLPSLLANTASQTHARVACDHCGQEVPVGLIRVDAEHQFCCAGCDAVYQTLHACGLEAYYRLRDADGGPTDAAKVSATGLEAFDSPSFHEAYVTRHDDGTAAVDLALEGATCAACVWLVERLPRLAVGVIEARLSLREQTVRVTWDPSRIALSTIAGGLSRLGYVAHPARGTSQASLHQKETRKRLVHLGVAGAIMGNVMLLALALYAGDAGQMEGEYRTFFRLISAALGTLALAWPGATFFHSAITAIRARTVNLDVPIALALAAGGAAGLVNVVLNRGEIYFDSLTVLIFLLLVGRFVQYRQQRRADDAVGLLFSLTPSICHLRQDGATRDVPVEALKAGNVVEVRAGELFPADGVVLEGRSTVNQALLTGESAPAAIDVGVAVFAGSQNVTSPVAVRVDRVGREARVGKLMSLIEQGVREKPPIVQFADNVAFWFLVAVTAASAGVFAVWWKLAGMTAAIDHTVALLIVTCPCVLGLATPLTIAIAIGKLSQRDILVKSGAAFEKLGRGGSVLLDKTGTLTEGRLELIDWTGARHIDGVDLPATVAALEGFSSHPIGRALAATLGQIGGTPAMIDATSIVERNDGGISGDLAARQLAAGSPRYMSARGVSMSPTIASAVQSHESNGFTAVVIAVDGQAVAVAALGDRLREDATEALRQLRRTGWEPAILSGDAQSVVSTVADRLEIPAPSALGRRSPEEKLDEVRRRRTDDHLVMMVGDGVNDAAALAAADVGIAVCGGAEASLSAADVYIARRGLQPIVELVEASRHAIRVIRRNLAVSLAYNILAGVLAAGGIMSPLIAAIIMPVSSATVLSVVVLTVGRRPAGRSSWK